MHGWMGTAYHSGDAGRWPVITIAVAATAFTVRSFRPMVANKVAAHFILRPRMRWSRHRNFGARPGKRAGARMSGDVWRTAIGAAAFGCITVADAAATSTAGPACRIEERGERDGRCVSGPARHYNMQGRFAGSPYYQGFDTPVGTSAITSGSSTTTTSFWGRPPQQDSSARQRRGMMAASGGAAGQHVPAALGVPWLNAAYVAV